MNVAFIPVRGGSKSIPLKNIKSLCGKPLVYWAVNAACKCKHIDIVYVSTDSEIIKNTVLSFVDNTDSAWKKVQVIGRSAESASDQASTEHAMLEFASQYSFDNIVLIQATSPLLEESDLDRGFEAFNSVTTDSVISVVRQKRFIWSTNKNGFAQPTNYDIFSRPRRQDFEGYYVENGAFYITSRKSLLASKNRISGNIKPIEMSEDTFFEIDEPSDWTIIEAFMRKKQTASSSIPPIKLFLTDCDGSLTDGGMYYSEKGDELKKFNTRDGMGLSFLRKNGVFTGIITSEKSELVIRRANKLMLDYVITDCKDKAKAINMICKEKGIDLKNVCYVGDDINDLEAIQSVGYGCCPADAVQVIKDHSKYISKKSGGEGAIRDIIDHILSSSK